MLLRRYEKPIYGYLVRMLAGHHDAEDITQQVLVRAIRGLPRYRDKGHFKAWLFRIAHREGIRAIRKRRLMFKQVERSRYDRTELDQRMQQARIRAAKLKQRLQDSATDPLGCRQSNQAGSHT